MACLASKNRRPWPEMMHWQADMPYQFINSQSYVIYVTEKLTVDHCFWSYTLLQTAPVLKPFEDHGRAHAHNAKIFT